MSKRHMTTIASINCPQERRQPGLGLAIGMGVLAVLGLGLSAYMSYEALLGIIPACGPIGDCETVHTSAYTHTFGVPVAVLGFLGYAAVAALGLIWMRASGMSAYLASLGILGLAIAGTLFSAYLTYIEFFVIEAFCPWCLASAAVFITILALAGISVCRQAREE